MRRISLSRLLPTLLPTLLLFPSSSPALIIQYDYSYDSNNFFSDPARRALLNQAASTFTSFSDPLQAISSHDGDTWSAELGNPSTGASLSIPNLFVPQDTLIIFVGAQHWGSYGALATGGYGGWGASGYDQEWFDTVANRGQSGAANSTDFGPWGGSISFNADSTWFFSPSINGIAYNQADFLSVAIHETAHVLGGALCNSFYRYKVGSTFVGPSASALYGSPVPLEGSHFAEGTMSTVNGLPQEAAMDPSLTNGTRKLFTRLDYASMADVGWQAFYPGDANMDGKINPDDYARLDRGFAKHLTGWANGDFNNDQVINAADYLILDTALYQLPNNPLPPSLLEQRLSQFGPAYVTALLSSLPEPSALLFASPLLLPRRRPRAAR